MRGQPGVAQAGRRPGDLPISLVVLGAVILIAAGVVLGYRLWVGRHRAAKPDAWSEVQKRGRLLVGTDPTYMPFSGYQGDYTGYEPELMREVARRLGVEIQFLSFGGDGLYEALQVGQVDCLASQIVIDPERTDKFLYTRPYFDAGQVLVTRAGAGIAGPGDLAGRVVAVELGSDGDAVARRLALTLAGGLTIVHTDSPPAALEAIARGSDAAIVDRLSALEYLRDHPELRLAPAAVTSEPYAVVTRADSPQLRQRIEDALQAMEEDGTFEALQDRWIPGAGTSGRQPSSPHHGLED